MSVQQLVLELGHRPAVGRADFLVAPCNALAVDWIDRWPVWPGVGLALWGDAACGKTHLAEVWRGRTGATRYRTTDLNQTAMTAVLAESACAVVDLEADALPAVAERPLLHLHNRLRDAGHQLLMISREAPARWGIALPDLRSRVKALPAVRIEAPDEALIAAVLVKLFADRQLTVAPGVIEYALGRMERSFAAAQRLAELVDRAALAAQRAVTVPLVRSVLDP